MRPSALLLLAALLSGQSALELGMKAQQAGDTDSALQHYRTCLEADAEAVACHWEIGWSYWKRSEWAKVVSHWETVKRLDPSHPEVDTHLPTARDNLTAERQLAQNLAASTASTARPSLPPGKTLRLRLVGDLMIGTTSPHPTKHLPPKDGQGYFAGVASLLQDADLTFGNLEGPLCDTTSEAAKCRGGGSCYAFRQPTRYVKYYRKVGFDVLSIANNHMMDFDEVCRMQTIEALDEAGIAWSGPPGSIGTVEAQGFKVGVVAFHSARHSNYINDHKTAKQLVRLAARTHDIVMVSFHGGAEGRKALHVPNRMETFYGEKRGHLRKFARAVIQAGADLVIGHGPHVLRGLEIVKGRLVAYSLGNFGTYDRFNLSGPMGLAVILEAEVDHEGRFLRGRLISTKQRGRGIPEPDPAQRGLALVQELTKTDFPRTGPTIARDGSFAPSK